MKLLTKNLSKFLSNFNFLFHITMYFFLIIFVMYSINIKKKNLRMFKKYIGCVFFKSITLSITFLIISLFIIKDRKLYKGQFLNITSLVVLYWLFLTHNKQYMLPFHRNDRLIKVVTQNLRTYLKSSHFWRVLIHLALSRVAKNRFYASRKCARR